MLGEPRLSPMVMNMRRPCQGYQHIHVEQSGRYSSSSALRTCSSVIGCAPRGTENTGNPEAPPFFCTLGVAFRPRRTSSDMALPRDCEFACARLLAAARRSSSMVTVVLMTQTYSGSGGDVKMSIHHDAFCPSGNTMTKNSCRRSDAGVPPSKWS